MPGVQDRVQTGGIGWLLYYGLGRRGGWTPPLTGTPLVPAARDMLITSAGVYTITYDLPISTVAGLKISSSGTTLEFIADILDVTGNALLLGGTIHLGTLLSPGNRSNSFFTGAVDIVNRGMLDTGLNLVDNGLIHGGTGVHLCRACRSTVRGSLWHDTGLLLLGSVVQLLTDFQVLNSGRPLIGRDNGSRRQHVYPPGPCRRGRICPLRPIGKYRRHERGSRHHGDQFHRYSGHRVTVASGETGTGANGTVTLSNGDIFNLTGITNGAGGWHVLTAPDVLAEAPTSSSAWSATRRARGS